MAIQAAARRRAGAFCRLSSPRAASRGAPTSSPKKGEPGRAGPVPSSRRAAQAYSPAFQRRERLPQDPPQPRRGAGASMGIQRSTTQRPGAGGSAAPSGHHREPNRAGPVPPAAERRPARTRGDAPAAISPARLPGRRENRGRMSVTRQPQPPCCTTPEPHAAPTFAQARPPARSCCTTSEPHAAPASVGHSLTHRTASDALGFPPAPAGLSSAPACTMGARSVWLNPRSCE